MDNTTAAVIQEMLRLAEFWFNMDEKNEVDVALGVRYLPAMHSTTLLWHLADFGFLFLFILHVCLLQV